MRLVLIGHPELDRSWKNDLAAGADALGWHTTVLQDHAVDADVVVDACKGADLLIWARTHRQNPTGDLAAMWRQVEAGGTATVSVHMDQYWGVAKREPEIGVHPFWLPQHVWTADGGSQDRFASRRVNHHWLIPPAPDRHVGRSQPRKDLACDVLFVGTSSPRLHHGRAQLLAWAAKRYGNGFRWVGATKANKVWGADLGPLYASARVVLGDSAPGGRYWSDRIPCTLGRGGVLVHPDTDGLAGQYDSALTTFDRGNFRQLATVIDGLLDDSVRRKAIRREGVAVIKHRHLWRHRLVEIATAAGLAGKVGES